MQEQSTRRRSLFDFEASNSNNDNFKINSGPFYTLDYIQKVNNEIDEWKHHLEKLDDKEHVKEKKMLKTRIYDESILTPEQLDFLGSMNFDNYIEKGTRFLKSACIFSNMKKGSDDMITQRLNDAQKRSKVFSKAVLYEGTLSVPAVQTLFKNDAYVYRVAH